MKQETLEEMYEVDDANLEEGQVIESGDECLVINKTTENGENETLRIIPRSANEISLY